MKKLLFVLLAALISGVAHAQDSLKKKVHFLSETDPVYENLEDYQKVIYELDKNAYRWRDSPRERVIYDSLINVFHADLKLKELYTNLVLPTPYENPISYFILYDGITKVEEQLKENGISLSVPRYGTLPTITLNASTNNTYPDKPLLIVNSGIFNFCHELIKVGFKTGNFSANKESVILDYRPKTLDSLLSADPELYVRFSKTLEDYANNRIIRGQAPLDSLQYVLDSQLVTCMEFFTIAHEIGHIVLHHVAIGSQKLELRLADTTDATQMPVNLHSWEQEIEADIFGCLLLNDYVKSHPSMFEGVLLTAPYLFFNLEEIADEASYILKYKSTPPFSLYKNDKAYEQFIEQIAQERFQKINNIFFGSRFKYQSSGKGNHVQLHGLSGNHPPAWLRAAMVYRIFQQNNKHSDLTFAPLGIGFSDNFNKMWDRISDAWVQISRGDTINHSSKSGQTSQMARKAAQNALNGNPKALESFMQFYERQRRLEEPVACDSLYNLGNELFDRKRYAESIPVLRQAEKCGVKSGTFYFVIGSAYLDVHDYKNARTYYSMAIKKDSSEKHSSYFWNYGNRAIAETELKLFSQAATDFTLAFKYATREDPQLYRERACLFNKTGRSDLALLDYSKAVKLEPQNMMYQTELYYTMILNGRYSSVINAEKKYRALSTKNTYQIVFDFYEFVSKVVLEQDTRPLEKRIEALCNDSQKYVWYFDDFEKVIKSKKLSDSKLRKIIVMETMVKACIKP